MVFGSLDLAVGGWCLGFGVLSWGFEFWVLAFGGSGSGVWGLGFGVWSLVFGVGSVGCGEWV